MIRPRRLLSIAHSYGVTLNRRLAHELALIDGGRWEVTAVAPKYFVGANDLRAVHLEPLPQELYELVPINAYLTNRVHFFVYGWHLRSLLAEPWDVVHCWEEPYILVGGQAAWWTPARTPLVFTTCQNLSKSYPPPFDWVERYAIGRAAGWIGIGQVVVENLRTRPGYDRLPGVAIPLGTDIATFRPDPAARVAIRHKLEWEAQGPAVVGYLGRFVPQKGLGLMMRALDRVSSPWRALFVGAGPLEPALREWAKRHGDRVRICSAVLHDDVPAYVNAMDILCAPSQTTARWKEQFGRMLVEAFACGVAVIGSDSGEIPYVVGDTGLVVSESDEPGWARAIAELIEDPTKRADLAARGVARAHDEFAWGVVARRYVEFFESVAGGPR